MPDTRPMIRRKNLILHKQKPARSGLFHALRESPGQTSEFGRAPFKHERFYTESNFGVLDFLTSTISNPSNALSKCRLIR